MADAFDIFGPEVRAILVREKLTLAEQHFWAWFALTQSAAVRAEMVRLPQLLVWDLFGAAFEGHEAGGFKTMRCWEWTPQADGGASRLLLRCVGATG